MAAAEALLTTLTVATGAAAETSDHTRTVVISLIVPLLLGAIGLAAVAFLAYRRERQREQLKRIFPPADHDADPPPDDAVAPPYTERTVVSAMVAVTLGERESSRLPVPVLPVIEVKRCRTCDREFRTALTKCPFDEGPLVAGPSSDRTARRDDFLDTRRSVMRCTSCDREYDLGAKYCTRDGEPLTAVERDDESVYYDGPMVCPVCGATQDSDDTFCPEDGARLMPLRPGTSQAAYAGLPITICPECLTEYPVAERVCPTDGCELLPLVGRTTGAHPATGFGRREKICPECGERFSADSIYCSGDGRELIRIN